jgi:hypothetical protein
LNKSVDKSVAFSLAKQQDAVAGRSLRSLLANATLLSGIETRCRIAATVKMQAESLLISTYSFANEFLL